MFEQSYPKKKSFFYGWLICERISKIKNIFFGGKMDEEELILIRVGIEIEMRYQRISEFRWKFHAQCYCNWNKDSETESCSFSHATLLIPRVTMTSFCRNVFLCDSITTPKMHKENCFEYSLGKTLTHRHGNRNLHVNRHSLSLQHQKSSQLFSFFVLFSRCFLLL